MSHCLNHGCALPSSLLLTHLTKLNVFSYLLFNIQYLINDFVHLFKKKKDFFSREIKGPDLSLRLLVGKDLWFLVPWEH